MQTLSIMQPWSWLIVNGHKDVENRDWQDWNPGLKVRGKILVHAGKNIDGGKKAYSDFRDDIFEDYAIEMPQIEDLQLGGIVGMTEILDVVTSSGSRWFGGPKGLVLGRSRPLPFMPYKGQLGFFEVAYDKTLLEAA